MDFFKGLTDRYNEIWKNIISPQRQVYFLSDLGQKVQLIRNVPVIRYDLDLKNSRGQILKCTFYSPEKYDKKKIGCVIYLHGNAGSRIEALTTYNYLLPRTALFCFDFAGAGKSEGEYVTLGINEAEDLGFIVEYIKKNLGIQKIAIWGRSMGAVTAINYCANHPNEVVALALDSGFINLNKILEEIGKQRTKIPNFLVDTVLLFIKNKIKSVLNMDIFSLDLIEQIKKIKDVGGIIFASAEKDSIINSYHTQKLYETFQGDKQIVKFDGDHNTIRPPYFFKSITQFIETRLYGSEILPLPTLADEEQEALSIKDVSFNAEDQFIQAIQSLPQYLDKTDQLVEQCMKQLEYLTFQGERKPNNQQKSLIQGISDQNQIANLIEKQKQMQSSITNEEKQINFNSFNNTKRIKQLCTSQNNQINNIDIKKSSYEQGILIPLKNQTKNSLTQRQDLVHSQQFIHNLTFTSQEQIQVNQDVRKSDNTFSRKQIEMIQRQENSKDEQLFAKKQSNSSNDQVLDQRKQDLLRRVFEEIDLNPTTPSPNLISNPIPSDLKMFTSAQQVYTYQNSSSNQSNILNGRTQDNKSKSPNNRFFDASKELEENQRQRRMTIGQNQMYQKESKEPGKIFPQKLLKNNLLNENSRRENIQIQNQGQQKPINNNQEQIQNEKTLDSNNLLNKYYVSSPQQNIQHIMSISTPNQGSKIYRDCLSNSQNQNPKQRALFGSLIDATENNILQNNEKIDNDNFNSNIKQNFQDYVFEEDDSLEENLGQKEKPKHSSNVHTLQELRGVDNKTDKITLNLQNMDTQVQPQDKIERQVLKENNKIREPPNQTKIIIQFQKEQNLQLQITQPIKQIHVQLQDQTQKYKNSRFSEAIQIGKNNMIQQQTDIYSYRRAALEPQNTQLEAFSQHNFQKQQKQIISNNGEFDDGRLNIHKINEQEGYVQNTSVGQRKNQNNSIDKKIKISTNDSEQFINCLNKPQISTKNIKNNIENTSQRSKNNQQQHLNLQNPPINQSENHFGKHTHSYSNTQQNQKNQFVQGYQNFSALNFKNIHSHPQGHQNNSNSNLNSHMNKSQNNYQSNNTSQNINTNVNGQNLQPRGVQLLSNQQLTPNSKQQISSNGIQVLGNLQNIHEINKNISLLNKNVIEIQNESRNQSPKIQQICKNNLQELNTSIIGNNQKKTSNYQIQPSFIKQLNSKRNDVTENQKSLHISFLGNIQNGEEYNYENTQKKIINQHIQPSDEQILKKIQLNDQVQIQNKDILKQTTPSPIAQKSSHINNRLDKSQQDKVQNQKNQLLNKSTNPKIQDQNYDTFRHQNK